MAVLNSTIDLSTEITSEKMPLPPELPADAVAKQLVLRDLNRAEYYLLAKGMTVEWDRDDRLYLFRVPQAFWEGSSVPRASLGIPLAYEHIESLLPQTMNALFADKPPFLARPRPKTSMDAARATQAILNFQLDNMKFRETVRLVAKEAYVYGTGVMKLGWRRYKKKVRVRERKEPKTSIQVNGLPASYQSKGTAKLVERYQEITVNEPYAEKVHIRHIIVDPALRVPDIREAGYVIHREYLTVEDLEKLRDQPGYTLPATEELQSLFDPPKESPERSLLEGRQTTSVLNTGISSLDINMEFKAMPRWQEATADPNRQVLEVLEYWTKDRCIVILNRKLCIKNDVNEFGEIPFRSVCFSDVLDSFYGLGIVRLLAGEQRLQQGVINSRLDDLSLRLSGTFLRKRGSNTPTQQLRLRPGGIIDSDDDKGVQMIEYPPAITDAFAEVEASDARAQRRTGANELVTQGSQQGPSSITRTATGMNTLAAGVGARAGYFIDFISDLLFVPALEFFHECNSRWLDEEQVSKILTDELAQDFEGEAMEIINARLKFEMLASAKMRAKQMMAQNLPIIMNFFLAAPVQGALQDAGKKVDFAELAQMVFDVSDWPGRQSLIVPMTKEDMQRQAQKNEMLQAHSLAAQKHNNLMEEIQQKSLGQSATHVVRGLIDEVNSQGGSGEDESQIVPPAGADDGSGAAASA